MYDANKNEQEILKYWQDNKIFEKSVSERPENKPYVFYDGPPFATGLPHYGHILSSVIKDVVPRYQTMKGFRVRRRWGWDCHGMPIENIVERELKVSGKRDIEDNLGVDKFNEICRSKVLTYTHDWKKMVEHIGRWVEFDNAYKTMDQTYMESVWWALKTIWNKGLIYEGRKVLMYCPRCETPVSKAEVAMDDSYRDIKEETVTAKFKIKRLKDYKIDIPENTYILAWTTTPWTLPGNVALAVGEKMNYSLVKVEGEKDFYLLATVRLNFVLADKKYEVVETFSGEDLVGLEYEPLFDIPAIHETKKKAWYVTSADFVTTEEGTGVVHTAVVYGEDDYNLGLKIGLPVVPLLDEKGHFNDLSPELIRGQYFKKAEKVIKEDLEKRGLLFSKANHTHSYPHCWRCETQLYYNAISAWFINIQKIKERLIKLNKKVNWVPEHLKAGRFLNILETAPDWNISRNRYWATPLPFWRCQNGNSKLKIQNSKPCGNVKCVGSIDELREKGDRKITKIIFVRHGEATHEIEGVKSSAINQHPLTKAGIKQITDYAKNLNEPVDLIISSPILRCKQTAEILQKKLKVDLVFSDLIKEYNTGKWEELKRADLEKVDSYQEYKKLNLPEEKFNYHLGETGESKKEIVERVAEFLQEINKKYSGQTILVVSHGGINAAIGRVLSEISYEQYFIEEDVGHLPPKYFYIDVDGKGLDLHKHNVDKIKLTCEECGGVMERIPEVIDCWVESASMPFAEWHYPFENQETFKNRFPGQYIAEYIAQTRAWFYYMHTMATLLFDDISFENVVCTGTILNEKGEKLSKSKMNYTDPWKIIEQYGVDALRYYLMTSVVMQADNLYFSDREVKDVYNKVINILWNVVEFYRMYSDEQTPSVPAGTAPPDRGRGQVDSKNILDKWILAKLNLLIKEVTENMDKYDTVRAGRPVMEFINDLSTWYLRRSRDRFKGEDVEGKNHALATLHFVLSTLSKIMAPFTPFIAEKIYQEINKTKKQENSENVSVHLEIWPEVDKKMIDEKLLKEMDVARKIVEMGLALRAENGVKVRQPLATLYVETRLGASMSDELKYIIAEELNVKIVSAKGGPASGWENMKIKEDGDLKVALDINLTPELKKEGLLREIVRTINQIRKEQKLTIHDRVTVEFETAEELLRGVFEDFKEELKKFVLAVDVVETHNCASPEIEIEGMKLKLKVEKK